MIHVISAALGFLFGVVLTPYLRSYSMRKGENLATHEDIDKLVDQVKAVTEATSKIEAEISTGIWDKQKRWEMKREVLFEAARRISEIDAAMLSCSIVMKEDVEKHKSWEVQPPTQVEELSWGETKYERLMRWTRASTDFDESRAFVMIVCSKDAAQAFSDLGGFINNTAALMTKDASSYDRSRAELIRKILLAQKAIRNELEVDRPG